MKNEAMNILTVKRKFILCQTNVLSQMLNSLRKHTVCFGPVLRSRNYLRTGARAKVIFFNKIGIYCSQFGLEDDRMKKNLHLDIFLILLLLPYSTALSGNLWQELDLEPEPQINNFGSATLFRPSTSCL